MGGERSGPPAVVDRNPLKPVLCRCDDPVNDHGSCVRCGHSITGAAASEPSPLGRTWTRPGVIRAIRVWAHFHDGRPPTQLQWAGLAREIDYPEYRTVRALFGTWKAALEAAGFTPPAQGRKPKVAA